MTNVKKFAPPAVALLIAVLSLTVLTRPDLLTWGGVSAPNAAVIVRETSLSAPLSPQWVEVFAVAPKLGIAVWDQNVLGKGKQPSAEAKPFLDAAKDKELPVLVLRFPGGSVKAQPCPGTLDALKKAVGR